MVYSKAKTNVASNVISDHKPKSFPHPTTLSRKLLNCLYIVQFTYHNAIQKPGRRSTIHISEMAGDEVKLLGLFPSPFVLRSQIALGLKGVVYELMGETIGKKSELLLKSNPVYKKVPVLLHGSRPVCESMIIVEYVDEVWKGGPPIVPSDPYDRAIARFWAAYVDDKYYPSQFNILKSQADEERAPAVEQFFAALQVLEEAFEKCSKGKGFFGGDTIGYVDVALGSHLGWLKAAEKMTGVKLLDEVKTPVLVGWSERFCADKVVKELMPETETLVELSKVLQPIWRGEVAATN